MKQLNDKEFDLKIDFREQRSGIIEEIGKLTDKITIAIVSLPTGDYLIKDKIIVERKTLSDFLVSIKNGRVFQQAYRIAQSAKNGLIILEGNNKTMVKSSEMPEKAVQGALIHLEVFVGIPVIHSSSIHETANLLIDIFHQCQRQELPRQKHIITKTSGIQINKKQRQKLFLIQNLPGIGTKKGLALLSSFGTIENLIKASPADLKKLKGIGNKLAGHIFSTFHEPF